MKRNTFLKILAIPAGIAGTLKAAQLFGASSDAKNALRVGHEHIEPTDNINTSMKTILHKAATRGHANHGWLNSHHTFSFANYYNPERMSFGALRVLNDDIIAGGTGFGTHPHNNFEIVSIPISGALEHKDSMGNRAVIKQNEVQIMSAGTGITHSEYNANKDDEARFLQIWVFPKEMNIAPRYEQKVYMPEERVGKLQLVVSPLNDDAVTINQDAYFSLGNLTAGQTLEYKNYKEGNGVYAFVMEGDMTIANTELNRRDGLGVWDTNNFTLTAKTDAQVLLMEVPMNV